MDKYRPINGWFDLSKLKLPKNLFKAYAKLHVLGEQYQRTYLYQKEHNAVQLQKLKELCAAMNFDLIVNYHALDEPLDGQIRLEV